MMKCPKCGHEQEEMVNECLGCGLIFSKYQAEEKEEVTEEAHVTPKEPVEGDESIKPQKTAPWEEREDLGFFKAIFLTIKEVLFSPTKFFSEMKTTGGISEPLLYAVIVGTVCGWMGLLLWQIPFQGLSFLISPDKEGAIISLGVMIGISIFTPLFIVIGLFITAGILHLCLVLVGGNKKGFEATFRVTAYSASANVGVIIPLCGGIIAGVWGLVIEIIGLREAHQTTTLKAILAVFLPVVAGCLCAGIFLGFAFLIPFISICYR